MAARGAPKGRREDEVELATKTIQVGGKRFNLDVRENKIGRYVALRFDSRLRGAISGSSKSGNLMRQAVRTRFCSLAGVLWRSTTLW